MNQDVRVGLLPRIIITGGSILPLIRQEFFRLFVTNDVIVARPLILPMIFPNVRQVSIPLDKVSLFGFSMPTGPQFSIGQKPVTIEYDANGVKKRVSFIFFLWDRKKTGALYQLLKDRLPEKCAETLGVDF